MSASAGGERTSLRSLSCPARPAPGRTWAGSSTGCCAGGGPRVRNQARLLANPAAFERDGRAHLSDRGTGGRSGPPTVGMRATGVVRRGTRPGPGPRWTALDCAGCSRWTGAREERSTWSRNSAESTCCFRPAPSADASGAPAAYVAAGPRRRGPLPRRGPRPHRDRGVEPGNGYCPPGAAAHLRADAGPSARRAPVRWRAPAGRTARDRGEHRPRVAGDRARCRAPAAARPAARSGWPLTVRHAFVRPTARTRGPLLEVLDPRWGLGAPEAASDPPSPTRVRQPPGRDSRARGRGAPRPPDAVLLGDETPARLDAGGRLVRPRPHSTSLPAARSRRHRRGDYRLLVGPISAPGGGTQSGTVRRPARCRRTEVLEPRPAERDHCTGRTERRARLPAGPDRAANVTVRPQVYAHEVVDGPSRPASTPTTRSPISELLVSFRGGRLRVRWPGRPGDLHLHMPGTCSTRAARRRRADCSSTSPATDACGSRRSTGAGRPTCRSSRGSRPAALCCRRRTGGSTPKSRRVARARHRRLRRSARSLARGLDGARPCIPRARRQPAATRPPDARSRR